MRNLWKPSTRSIGGLKAVELRTTCLGLETVEYCLASKYGEIWELGGGRYAAIAKRVPGQCRSLEEKRSVFGEGELESWIMKFKISNDPADQTPFANNFEL